MVAALVYGARASHIPFKGHKSHPLLRKRVFPGARPKTESPEDRGKTEPLEHVKVNLSELGGPMASHISVRGSL